MGEHVEVVEPPQEPDEEEEELLMIFQEEEEVQRMRKLQQVRSHDGFSLEIL